MCAQETACFDTRGIVKNDIKHSSSNVGPATCEETMCTFIIVR